MFKPILDLIKEKPKVYSESTAPFWDDFHISKGMLESHLAHNVEAATRKYDFILKSVEWISNNFLDKTTPKLLDLGCGPGIYTELLCEKGFRVVGIDFSKRSIEYAIQSATLKNISIDYYYQNYLEIDYVNVFDVITLIYCDFGVLSPVDREILLTKIKKALKPNGTLILDAMAQHHMDGLSEGNTATYSSEGFWSPSPHLCIQNNYLYPETNNSLEQYIVLTENECQCYNIWNQIFSVDSLTMELIKAGFEKIKLYDDVTGKAFTNKGNTICVVAQ